MGALLVVALSSPDTSSRTRPGPLVERAPRAATAVTGVLVAVAGAVYVVKGRAQWFFQDEWAFLAERDAGSLHGLFDPHNEHWVTLPVLVYRLLWNLVGARRYEPYQAMSIAVHLAIVVLLLVILRRRMGVAPWVAAAAPTPLLFTGLGAENVLWAFQITFGGSLLAGLGLLLLADHPDPSPRRRAATFACGLVSLMCSGVGLLMVGIAALAILVRRGWRRALEVTVPLGVTYGAWYAAFGVDSADPRADVGLIARFVRTGLDHAVRGLGPSVGAAGLVVLVTLVGLVLLVWEVRRSPGLLRRRLGLPLSMAVGAVGFFVLTGSTRAESQGLEFATRGRYAYAATLLLLPLVALGADTVIRRSPVMAVPVLVLLVAAVPANIGRIEPRKSIVIPPVLITATAVSPALADTPADLQPFPEAPGFRAITVGWLREHVADGDIPTDGTVDRYWEAEALARLTLRIGDPLPDARRCHEIAPGGEEVEVTEGRPVAYAGRVRIMAVGPRGGRSYPRPAGSFEPRAIATTGAPVTVLVEPVPAPFAATLCR